MELYYILSFCNDLGVHIQWNNTNQKINEMQLKCKLIVIQPIAVESSHFESAPV